eukprot:NODE_246_length_12992_cov_0.264407.p3 type:complete len:335 gc:universal NODE_246_length_12992_cov_0.264407:6731-7735(+)
MDFYLGKHVKKFATNSAKSLNNEVEPTDEVLIMLFTNINLKKLTAMFVINVLLKYTMNLSWSDFVSLSLMIIMMRHIAIRLAYFLFVGYLVDEILLSMILCAFAFYDLHFDFVGDQFILNTTWYYLVAAHGTMKGIVSSSMLVFINYSLGFPLSLYACVKQISLCVFMHFISILNIKRPRHPTDPVFDVNHRKVLYSDQVKLQSIVKEYCGILSKETNKYKSDAPLKTIMPSLELFRYVRAISILISRAELEDENANMSIHFIQCISTLATAYNCLVFRKAEPANQFDTLWKVEKKPEVKKIDLKLENGRCQLIEGKTNLSRIKYEFVFDMCAV